MAEVKLAIECAGNDFHWGALVGLVPHVIWAVVALIMLRWIGIDAIRLALARLNKIGVAGLELEFREEVEAAVEARGKPAPVGQVGRVARRLSASGHLVRGAQILWVDDEPENNRLEARPLLAAGASIVFVRSTDEAIDAAVRTPFDLVISDIARGNDAEVGLRMPGELAARGLRVPVIFYVSQAQKPAPPDAFGMTDRPDELLHLVLDALARQRG
jgi:CheY-like chemotaxis protein